MATIKVSNLHPTGAELFSDFESYMSELSDQEIVSINGGTYTPLTPTTATIVVSPRVRRITRRYL